MTTYPTQRWFLHYTRVVLVVFLGGGAVMLAFAAGAHDSASIPLLAFGGFWLAAGAFGLHTQRTVAREVQLEGDQVTFVFPSKLMTVPASDITEIRRARYDFNRMRWLDFRTASSGRIRVSARLRGMVELFVALRTINPKLKLGDNL